MASGLPNREWTEIEDVLFSKLRYSLEFYLPVITSMTPQQQELLDRKSNNRLLVHFLKESNLNEAQHILPRCDPKFNDSEALRVAAAQGQLDMVKLLLPRSNVFALGSEALMGAAMNNHVPIIQILHRHMERLDTKLAKYGATRALAVAARNDYQEAIRFLVPRSDVDGAFLSLIMAESAADRLSEFVSINTFRAVLKDNLTAMPKAMVRLRALGLDPGKIGAEVKPSGRSSNCRSP